MPPARSRAWEAGQIANLPYICCVDKGDHGASFLVGRRVSGTRRGDLTPWAVGAVACLLYLATLSNHYSGDSIEYALAIESANPASLLDPSHPLLHPAGLLWYRVWQLMGWSGRALLPLQVLNALAGGFCAGLLTAIAGGLSKSRGLAVAAGLGFAVSGGLWMLGVEAEFVTAPLALMLAVLWGVLCVTSGTAARGRYPILLGAATAVAVAGYASNLLLAPVVSVGLLTDHRLDPALRRRHCMVYVTTMLLLLVPAYLAFLAAWSGSAWQHVPAYFFGRSYGHFAPFDIPHGIYAFLRSLALYPNLSLEGTTRQFLAQTSAPGRLLFAGYYGLVLLAVLAPIGLAWRHRHELWPAERQPLLVLATWTMLFSAFGFYWVPGDQSFWLPVLAAWWLTVALALGSVQDRGLRTATVVAVVAALAIGNGLFEVVPRHDIGRNVAFQVTQQALANTTPEDVLLVRGDDIAGLYLTYWGGRQVAYLPSDVWIPEELLPRAGAAQTASGKAAPRLIIIDSDDRRAGWWDALVEASEQAAPEMWLSSIPDWHAGGGLVMELTSVTRPP
jgi:hypothetical protein